MVMMMWWSNLLNSAFVQSIIKAVLGALVLFGLVKSIRKDAADDKENEVKLDQANAALEASEKARRIKDEVHKEVNAIPEDELDDYGRKLGILRDD